MAKRIFVAGDTLPASQLNAEVKTTFGGDGSDGALNISSGTTTIDCANAAVVIKQYTSISITGTGKLAFSNPNTNGTIIILKSQGDVTLTSSQTPMIDCANMGAAGGTALSGATGVVNGNDGNDGNGFLATISKGKGGFGGSSIHVGSSQAGGSAAIKVQLTSYISKYYQVAPGSGGGGGGKDQSNGTSNPAAGGRGGGGLIVECAGALNFTTSSGISVAGANGTNATVGTSTQCGLGGGSGGGGGFCLILYNSLTSASGTVTVSGGAAGSGASTGISSGLASPWGSSGGGSMANTGTTSLQGTDTTAADGVTGGDGIAIIAQNKDIA
ncbi:MAG TPA: hypothetical protein VFX17_02095 [Patescibacteria group bacterium]|nr:hypothetical protein [Patescibacteria group bacterium]